MAINALTVRRMAKARQEADAMKAPQKIAPQYYLVRYGSDRWENQIAFDTRTDAQKYVKSIYQQHIDFTYCNITRRYRHGQKIQTGTIRRTTVESLC